MRSYGVDIAALALDVPRKWLDNVLSQHVVQGVLSVNRGVARRIPHPALVRLAVVRQLHQRLGLGVADALRVANALIETGETPAYTSGHLRLVVDRASLEQELNARLAEVLESAPLNRRGRPSAQG